jgi:hypothetical protein
VLSRLLYGTLPQAQNRQFFSLPHYITVISTAVQQDELLKFRYEWQIKVPEKWKLEK